MMTVNVSWSGQGTFGRAVIREELLEEIKVKHQVTEILPRTVRVELRRSRPGEALILFTGNRGNGTSVFAFAFVDISEVVMLDSISGPPSTPRVKSTRPDRPG